MRSPQAGKPGAKALEEPEPQYTPPGGPTAADGARDTDSKAPAEGKGHEARVPADWLDPKSGYTRNPDALEDAIWQLPISVTHRAFLSHLLRNAYDLDQGKYKGKSGARRTDTSLVVPASYAQLCKWVAGTGKNTAVRFVKAIAPVYVIVHEPVGRQPTLFEFDAEALRRIVAGTDPSKTNSTHHGYSQNPQLYPLASTVAGKGTVPTTGTVTVPTTGTVTPQETRPRRAESNLKTLKTVKGVNQGVDSERSTTRATGSVSECSTRNKNGSSESASLTTRSPSRKLTARVPAGLRIYPGALPTGRLPGHAQTAYPWSIDAQSPDEPANLPRPGHLPRGESMSRFPKRTRVMLSMRDAVRLSKPVRLTREGKTAREPVEAPSRPSQRTTEALPPRHHTPDRVAA